MKTRFYVLLTLAFLIFFACARESKSPQVTSQTKVADTEIKKEAWQVEWDKTLAQAKKEGKVVIFFDATMPSVVRETWVKNFQGKYGVELEFIMGRGAENSVRLLNERKAGLYTGDLITSGLTTLYLVLEPAGAFESLENKLFLPEVLDPKAWFDGRLPWFTKEKLIFMWRLYPTKNFWINTQLIKPGDITSYRDILKPQWKGRKFVLNDPTVSGPASKWFEVNVQQSMLGADFMRELARQEPVVIRDLRLGAEWIAQGKYPFSIAIELGSFEPFIMAGSPVAPLELKEPGYITSGSGNLAWIKQNPHPAATKLFVNWLLSIEGQKLTQDATKVQSSREDTGVEELVASAFRKKGMQYYNANTEEGYKNLEPLKQLAKDIFSPLAK